MSEYLKQAIDELEQELVEIDRLIEDVKTIASSRNINPQMMQDKNGRVYMRDLQVARAQVLTSLINLKAAVNKTTELPPRTPLADQILRAFERSAPGDYVRLDVRHNLLNGSVMTMEIPYGDFLDFLEKSR